MTAKLDFDRVRPLLSSVLWSGDLRRTGDAPQVREEEEIVRRPRGRGMRPKKKMWTKEDDGYLAYAWGHERPDKLAKQFGCTVAAVHSRACELSLNGFNGFLSLNAVAEKTGYLPAAVKRIAKRFGIPLRRYPCERRHKDRKGRFFAITEEQYELVVAAIHSLKAPTRIVSSVDGEWGVGEKPDVCRCCGTADRPHKSRGLCRNCYKRIQRRGELAVYPPVKNERWNSGKVEDGSLHC